MHDGYSFNRKNDGKKVVQYNCINNRGKHPVCSAQISILKIDGSIVEKGDRGNICAQKIRNGNPLKDVTNVDFSQEMMERFDELAIETLGLQPAAIWKKFSAEITVKSRTWKGMTDNQVINRVNNICRKYYGGDALCVLEQPSAGMVQNSNYWFLQFSCAITDNETNKLEKKGGSGIQAFLGAFWGSSSTLH